MKRRLSSAGYPPVSRTDHAPLSRPMPRSSNPSLRCSPAADNRRRHPRSRMPARLRRVPVRAAYAMSSATTWYSEADPVAG